MNVSVSMKNNGLTNRRTVLKGLGAAATVNILPSSMLFGQNSPSEQFRFAKVGCGGKGIPDTKLTIQAGAKLVAMCDVDRNRAASALKNHSDVPFYEDYRVMLDKHDKEIDGVVISTPDHTHACIALDAIRRGKHVYVQKPLARTYEECRALLEASKKYKVATQMGNQHHSAQGFKVWEKMFADKALGDISEVQTWCHKSYSSEPNNVKPGQKVPDTLNWDLWLGPAAKRQYAKEYLPFVWRNWWDFGAGALGDMACHIMDAAFWNLQLGLPDKIIAKTPRPANEAYPEWAIVDYTFNHSPVTGKPLKLRWADGNKGAPKPKGCNPNLELPNQGCYIAGSEMTAMSPHPGRPLPIALGGQEYSSAVKDAERHWRAESKKLKGVHHYARWIDAAKSGKFGDSGSNFDYSVPLTQAVLLGCIAQRFPGEELHWDQKQQRFSNHEKANQWLSFNARSGFDIN